MSTTNPCSPDCSFPADPVLADAGCCSPAPTTRDCEAPTLPVPACTETGMVTTYDPDTETFTVLTTLYDSLCSALTDSTGSPLTTAIA